MYAAVTLELFGKIQFQFYFPDMVILNKVLSLSTFMNTCRIGVHCDQEGDCHKTLHTRTTELGTFLNYLLLSKICS